MYRNSVNDVIEASFHQLLDVQIDTECAVDLSVVIETSIEVCSDCYC